MTGMFTILIMVCTCEIVTEFYLSLVPHAFSISVSPDNEFLPHDLMVELTTA